MIPRSSVRVVCLVPSWTETLLEASVKVVGRTRYCIHPKNKVMSIPAIGGTKNLNLKLVLELNPDFVLLDHQENTQEMAQQLSHAGIKLIVTDVTDEESLIIALRNLSFEFNAPELAQMADRYQRLKQIDAGKFLKNILLEGEVETVLQALSDGSHFEYLIWKNPYMVIGQQTFIAANLKQIGIHLTRNQKYPEVTESDLKNAFCLFSSEPFPFAKDYNLWKQQGFSGAFVDAEKISWFGIRNLKFLESSQK